MKKYFPQIFLVFVIIYLLFLIRPALFGQLDGTFNPRIIPEEYIKLEHFIITQKHFSRILWIPMTQRFGFYSPTHPAVSAYDFFHVASLSGALGTLDSGVTEEKLRDVGVKYIVVPYDSEGEIFLRNRKYDNALYENTIVVMQGIKWLHEIMGFGRIHIFEVTNPKDHFWSSSDNLRINYSFINPTEYKVDIQNAKQGDLVVFSEGFDKNWVLKGSGLRIQSSKFGLLNSFVLPKDGNFEFKVYYEPQKWVNIGLAVSAVTLFSILIYLAINLRRKVSLRS